MEIELQNVAKRHKYELILQLSRLSKLLEKSSLPNKRKLLSLILSNNPILTADMWIGNIVNQSVLLCFVSLFAESQGHQSPPHNFIVLPFNSNLKYPQALDVAEYVFRTTVVPPHLTIS
jgi:hypothetical protein